MNRCQSAQSPLWLLPSFFVRNARRFPTLFMCWMGLGLALANYSQAQGILRTFPPEALRGRLLVTQPPQVTLNGLPARLSPGARIRGDNNLLVLSGALVGQERLVNYTREPNGLIHNVWILSESEAQVPRDGLPIIGTVFPSLQTDGPKVDDGRTPYDQLPGFKP